MKRAKQNTLKKIWILIIPVSILAIFLFISHFVFYLAIIPSSSMENTIMPGDFIVGTRNVKDVQRGDIIIFPAEDGSTYIKRVIGLPGETVTVSEGKVYINGERISEGYLKEKMETEDAIRCDVPEDSYFVMGDNRNNSNDSRYWDNPYVKAEDIQAKAVVRILPLRKMGGIR